MHGTSLEEWIRESYDDAIRMASNAHFAIDEDQGDDDTRNILFPGLDQQPTLLQNAKNVFGRAAQREDFQEAATLGGISNPQIRLVFYCGDSNFVPLADQGFPGHFYDPWARTTYNMGADQTTPCGGSTLAVTGQGFTPDMLQFLRYGTVLCNVLDRGSLASVARALEYDPDLIGDGADIDQFGFVAGSCVVLHELFHVTSFDLSKFFLLFLDYYVRLTGLVVIVLPENQGPGEPLKEEYNFGRATVIAGSRNGLDYAMKNPDSYVFFAFGMYQIYPNRWTATNKKARNVGGIYWEGGKARTERSDNEEGD
ncbi:MAG: hypothetical protein Q9178_007510 [Gyalolechia marmorata]